MSYSVYFKPSAEREFKKLDPPIKKRIAKKLEALALKPFPSGSKRLVQSDNFRLRIGDFRVLYTVNEKSKRVWILAVGHRKEVYR